MKTLRQIMDECGSDKGGQCVHRHNYVAVYELLFRPLRDKPVKLLELGVANGASIRAWLEYFPKAGIIGVDFDLAAARGAIGPPPPRLKLCEGRLEDTTLVPESNFDIIIDDADHALKTQFAALSLYWPRLVQNGIYVIEDLFVGKLPWGGEASPKTISLSWPYRGRVGAPSVSFFPKRLQDIAFLSRKGIPPHVGRILDDNDHFFTVTNVSGDGGLHAMLILHKTSINDKVDSAIHANESG